MCCVSCFERFVKFINTNAFTLVAMTSKNFCSAAEEAFFLMLRNPARFAIAGGIGGIF